MKHDHSIEGEPQFQKQPARIDPSEAKAAKKLARERARGDDDVASQHSVHNEPAIFPGMDGRPIERDWTCSSCGYNLRGLTTGHPCPECGHIEVYHPPSEGEESYGRWLAEKRAAVSPSRSWTIVTLASVACAPVGFFAATLIPPVAILWAAAVAAPAFDEVVKVAALLWLLEAKPYLIRSRTQILTMAACSALVFATAENLLYQAVYPGAATPTVFAWRWVVCIGLHVICTLIAAGGIVRVWTAAKHEGRPPSVSRAAPELVFAMILHGAYNATIMSLNWPGLMF